MRRAFLTALFRSSFKTSETRFTASSADCTEDAQEPHALPLIPSVTVASFEATERGIAAPPPGQKELTAEILAYARQWARLKT
jgi:hypothetical protein